MIIDINGKECEIIFGFEAIDYLDKKYPLEIQGLKQLGQGIQNTYNYLTKASPTAICEAIYAGTITEKDRASMSKIKEKVMQVATENENGLQELADELVEELKKQPLTKGVISKLEKDQEVMVKAILEMVGENEG